MTAVLTDTVWKELCYHYSTDNTIFPSKDWTEQHIYQLLQQYPAGISRAILLTELEYKWFVEIRIFKVRNQNVSLSPGESFWSVESIPESWSRPCLLCSWHCLISLSESYRNSMSSGDISVLLPYCTTWHALTDWFLLLTDVLFHRTVPNATWLCTGIALSHLISLIYTL